MASGSRRRGRILIYIALILLLVLILVWALIIRPGSNSGILSSGQTTSTPSVAEATVNIVVTSQAVQRGVPLTEAQLTTIPYPKASMDTATFYTNVKDVVGARPKVDLDAKVPVTKGLVVEGVEGSPAAFQIPKGMVAISVPINSLSSVSYAPQAGDHVNIITTMLFLDLDTNSQTALPNTVGVMTAPGTTPPTGPDYRTAPITPAEKPAGRVENEPGTNTPLYVYPSEAQRPRMVSQTLLQDAIVIQVGEYPEANAPVQPVVQTQPTPTPVPGGQEQPAQAVPEVKRPAVITLVVNPQDAVTLNYLMFQRQLSLDAPTRTPTSSVQLTLVLRGATDDSRVQTEAVTLQYLMDQYNIPLPAKLPYGLEPSVRFLTSPWLEQPEFGYVPR